MNVELLLVPDCPHANAARALLADCADRLALHIDVQERVGAYPSPTILVHGVDVMTGAAGTPRMQACRLDVPTASRVLAALRNASAHTVTPAGGIVTTGPDRLHPEAGRRHGPTIHDPARGPRLNGDHRLDHRNHPPLQPPR